MMKAWNDFVKRVLPEHWDQVFAEKMPPENGREVYEIAGEEGMVLLRGSSVNSLAAALGWYLRYDAEVNLSWCGSRMELPKFLPKPAPYRRVIEQKYRAYFNYCTFNYSASWWDWQRWEKELDFMALQGVNLPLSAVGIECTWYETLRELGFTEEEALAFFSGPAFLAWQWMTNIEGFAGPIPKSWIEKRRVLGQQIIQRQLALGMTPIQQGFSGFVPRLLQEKLPKARIQRKADWCGIAGTAQLDPTDPAFQRIGRIFLEKQKALFGAYGFYAADPFHEGTPPVDTPEYLQEVGRAIDGLVRDFDPKGVWVMQSWSIRKPIVCAVPRERLLILDLAGTGHSRHDGFWGYPFVTGNLHNFGGRINLHGDLNLLAENSFLQIRQSAPNVCGTGLFMEGIDQNPVYYDLAFEMLTADRPADLGAWLPAYVKRRYGRTEPEWLEAWELLLKTAYAPGTNGVEKSSVLCARPAVNVKKSGPNDGFHIPYGNKRLFRAAELLAAAGSDAAGYRYDLADVTRQVLSNYGQQLYRAVSEAFKNRETETFRMQSQAYLQLLQDVDGLLSGCPELGLERWIRDARSWGDTEQERDYLEYCAGLLITLWGNEEEPHIFDYAWREWSGMVGGFYAKRWEIFFAMLQECLDTDAEYTEDTLPQVYGRESFRANACYQEMAEFETGWVRGRKTFKPAEKDAVPEARRLLARYRDKLV